MTSEIYYHFFCFICINSQEVVSAPFGEVAHLFLKNRLALSYLGSNTPHNGSVVCVFEESVCGCASSALISIECVG